jgi:hypothetical protein
MKLHVAMFCFLAVFVLFACTKEISCPEYNHSTPINRLSAFIDEKPILIFTNNQSDSLILSVNHWSTTNDYEERCGGLKNGPCECSAVRTISYISGQRGLSIHESLTYFDNEAVNYYAHSITGSQGSYYQRYNSNAEINSKIADSRDLSLLIDSISYQNIHEISLFNANVNPLSTHLQKVWIKPDSGLFKIWVNDTCWTRTW